MKITKRQLKDMVKSIIEESNEVELNQQSTEGLYLELNKITSMLESEDSHSVKTLKFQEVIDESDDNVEFKKLTSKIKNSLDELYSDIEDWNSLRTELPDYGYNK